MRLFIILMLATASLPAQNLKFKIKQLPKDTSVGRVVLSSLTDSTMTYSDLLKIDNDSLYFKGSGVLTSAMNVGGIVDLATDVTGTLPVANGGTGATSFTAGRVLFGNGTSAINTDGDLFWDNSNKKLDINNSSISSGAQSLNVYGFDGAANFFTTRGEDPFNNTISLYNNPSSGQGYGTGILFRAKSDDTNSRVQAAIYSSWTTATDASRTAKLVFRTTENGAEADKLTILGNGNVGIGTTSPSEKLDVVGNVEIDGKIDLNDAGNSVFIGFRAGEDDDGTDNRNVGIGRLALLNNENGYRNMAIGFQSLGNNVSGHSNVGIGYRALYNNKNGNNNFGLGSEAGSFVGSGTTNPLDSAIGSIYIGANSRALADNNSNEIVIGTDAIGNGSNSVTLGNTSITKTILNGNVGIGTTVPDGKLDVNGTSYFRDNIILYATKKLYLDSGSDTYLTEVSSNTMQFVTSDVERMRITSSGNVGIGTTSPFALLHLSEPSANTVFRLGNNSTYDQFMYFNGNNDWSLGMDYSNSNAFVLSNNSTIGTNDRVVVTTAGNVGIGTSTANERLVVNGGTTGSVAMRIKNEISVTGIRFENTDNSLGFLDYNQKKWQIYANNGSIPTLTVDGQYSPGYVGIGTTSPDSKLEVNGSATNTSANNEDSDATIDFSLSNIAYTNNTSSNITLTNIKDGGAYTLITTATNTNTAVTFTAGPSFTIVYMGTVARTDNKQHLYSFLVAGTSVYVTMATQN